MLESCSDAPAPTGLRRIALFPGNVLVTGAPDWVAAAVPVVLQRDLSSSRSLYAVIVNGDSDAYKAGASEAIEATVDGTPQNYAIFAGLRSLSTQRITTENPDARNQGLVASLDTLAKSVDAAAQPFPTRSETALGAYVSALESTDLSARVQHLRDAIRQAPDFGTAYVELIAAEAQSRASDVAADIDTARQNRGRFQALDRARLDALIARFQSAPLPQQAAAWTAVVTAAPNDADALSTLGHDQFLVGDAAAGERSVDRAIALLGNTPALQNTLIQGLVATKQFARATSLLAQQEHTPTNALERASCLLLSGDAAAADTAAAESFSGKSAADSLAPLRHAEWLAAKGDIAAADALAESVRAGDPNAGALAQAQAAVWFLQLGQKAQARQAAAASAHAATGPAEKEIATAVFLLATSDSGAQLRTRLDQAQARGRGRDLLVGYGYFLFGDYAGAAEAWDAVYRRSGGADLQSRIMLAVSYRHLNRNAEAAAVNPLPVLPNLTGTDPFATVAFGELRKLLGR